MTKHVLRSLLFLLALSVTPALAQGRGGAPQTTPSAQSGSDSTTRVEIPSASQPAATCSATAWRAGFIPALGLRISSV